MTKWFRVVKAVAFCAVFAYLFVSISYMLRPTYRTANASQWNALPADSLDVVLLGGSAVRRLIYPEYAWEEAGMTMYASTFTGSARPFLLSFLKDMRQRQHPGLYVIDLFTFQRDVLRGRLRNYMEIYDFSEATIRYYSDAVPYTFNRAKSLLDYAKGGRLPVPVRELLFDIMLYHDNIENLADPLAWDSADMRYAKPQFGSVFVTKTEPIQLTDQTGNDERIPLYAEAETYLREFLAYCRDEDLNVWFVLPPYAENDVQRGQMNALADVVAEYGFDMTMLNDHVDEIALPATQTFRTLAI